MSGVFAYIALARLGIDPAQERALAITRSPTRTQSVIAVRDMRASTRKPAKSSESIAFESHP